MDAFESLAAAAAAAAAAAVEKKHVDFLSSASKTRMNKRLRSQQQQQQHCHHRSFQTIVLLMIVVVLSVSSETSRLRKVDDDTSSVLSSSYRDDHHDRSQKGGGRRDEEGRRRTIEIYFTRHGLSCNNVAEAFVAKRDLGGDLARVVRATCDEPLSDVGVNETKPSRLKPDIVLSSPLIRAQETAALMYPSSDIYVAPYVGEMDRSYCPRPIFEQKAYIASRCDLLRCRRNESQLNTMRFNYSLLEDERTLNAPPNLDGLLNRVLSIMIRDKTPVVKRRPKIAVVSHSEFLTYVVRNLCRSTNKAFDVIRNEMTVRIDMVQSSAGTFLRSPVADCQLVQLGYEVPSTLPTDAVKRCSETIRNALTEIRSRQQG